MLTGRAMTEPGRSSASRLPPLRSLISTAALGGGVALAAPAIAAAAPMTFVVDSSNGGPTDSGCNSTAGDCSIADAVAAANSNPGADTITFASSISGQINLTTTLEVIESLKVDGPGAELLTLNRGYGGQILRVTDSVDEFSIEGLQLRKGKANTSTLASGLPAGGGAIYSLAETLTVTGMAESIRKWLV